MEQQATAEAVCSWTLNLRDPPDGLTNKAALLEREALFGLLIFPENYKKLKSLNQETVIGEFSLTSRYVCFVFVDFPNSISKVTW